MDALLWPLSSAGVQGCLVNFYLNYFPPLFCKLRLINYLTGSDGCWVSEAIENLPGFALPVPVGLWSSDERNADLTRPALPTACHSSCGPLLLPSLSQGIQIIRLLFIQI